MSLHTHRPLEHGHGWPARLRRLTDGLAGAVLGGAVYAAWVAAVNWDAGIKIAFTAALAHWVMSTFITYTGTGWMRRMDALGSTAIERIALAFFGGLAFTYAVLISVHQALGTPHLALTLAAGVVPNLLFCGGYALLLARTAAHPTVRRKGSP